MEIRIRQSGEVVSGQQFRERHENVSFPDVLDAATLDEYGADAVQVSPIPAHTQYQSPVRAGVVQIAGKWVQAWTVRDWSAEEIAAAQGAKTVAVQKATVVEIQNLLDTTAQEHGYDDLRSTISYVGSAVAFWNAEGARAKAWRDECWWAAYQIQEAVKAGTRALPTVAEVLAEMPAANWPQA